MSGQETTVSWWQRASAAPVVLYAIMGSAIAILVVVVHAHGSGMGWVALVQPGSEGDAASLIAEDFPELDLPSGRGHDGQYFYAVAQDPTDPQELAELLDRPRYRLQRPLLPALVWAIHPTGGGFGLVVAFAVVGGLSLVLLGVAAGSLSSRLGGPPWVAGVVPLLPGPLWSYRLGLAGNLAMGLTLLYLLSTHDHRWRRSLVFAVLAVLAREATLVVIVADALFRRSRPAALVAGTAVLAVAGWAGVLGFVIDSSGEGVSEFAVPFGGIAENVGHWTSGRDLLAAAMIALSLALSVVALIRRGPRHPLFAPLLASAAFSLVLGADVLGLDHNGSRAMTPTLLLALLATVTPDAEPDRRDLRPVARILAKPWRSDGDPSGHDSPVA